MEGDCIFCKIAHGEAPADFAVRNGAVWDWGSIYMQGFKTI